MNLKFKFLLLIGLVVSAVTLNALTIVQTDSVFNIQQKKSINEKKTQIAGSYDVIVCGGGPAGVAAAVSAARNGASVQLIEFQGALGGVMTSGLLTYLLDYQNKGGIMKEILNLMDSSKSSLHPKIFDPEMMKYKLERMCVDAKVEILYHTRVVNAIVKNKKITHVVTESTSGRQAWAAKVFIDCTGNGDLGAFAGCKYALGSPDENKLQAASFELIVSGLDYNEIKQANLMLHPSVPYSDMAKTNLYNEIVRAGFEPSYAKPVLTPIRDGLFNLCFNHQYNFNPFDAQNVAHATIEARNECFNVISGLRKLGGVWRNIQIVSTPEQIAIREGRRIKGLYVITKDDLLKGARFDDGVVRATFPVDIHYGDSKKGKSFGNEGIKVMPYDIPIRSLIAADVDNLMMAGRCISGDYFAHASYRVIGNAVAMGEAAGAFAAKSLNASKSLIENVNSLK